MLHFICLILLASGFILAQEKRLLCRSPDLELFYSPCDSSNETIFFDIKPCSLNGFSKWNGTIFWIPKRDLTFLRTILGLWYETKKVIEWKRVVCAGEDDDYTYCGALKGETINTTVRISAGKANYPMGEYTATLKGFSGYSEADLFICMNFTLILKKEPFYNFG
ncbi:lymphocyte antigen 96 [Eublepharis macularius]|uniref:Lymphocyte antigen 96 n=1 Tax=Eublepharis macularius TaxID=481883 RepID=A0AA97L420_EUBMA|nr:lymphocyte antigen 96 [Eublepharis macularius]